MRKLLTALTLLILTLPVLADEPNAADGPSAMVTHLTGSAVMVVDGQKTFVEPMTHINPKTLVELRGGAKMTVVYFASGAQENYTGPALIGIGSNRGKVFHGDDSARTVVTTGSNLVKAVDPHALTETPDFGPVSITSADGKTVFSWTTEKSGPYHVSVFKPAQGQTPRTKVWAEQTNDKSITYGGPTLNSAFSYVVLVEVGRDKIGASLFREVDGSAQVFDNHQAEATKMSAADPTNPTPHVLLSTLYTQHGQTDKAKDSMQMAINAQPDEDAFIARMKTMTKQISEKADADTAEMRGIYQAQDNWALAPYYDPMSWPWSGWDNDF